MESLNVIYREQATEASLVVRLGVTFKMENYCDIYVMMRHLNSLQDSTLNRRRPVKYLPTSQVQVAGRKC